MASALCFVLGCAAGGVVEYRRPSPVNIAGLSRRVGDTEMRVTNLKGTGAMTQMESLRKVLSTEELAKRLQSDYGVNMTTDTWVPLSERLYGYDSIRVILERNLDGNVEMSDSAAAQGSSVAWPSIELLGYTRESGRIVLSLRVDGGLRFWEFRERSGKWESEAVLPGFGIHESGFDETGKFRVVLYSAEQVTQTNEYTLSLGGASSSEASLSSSGTVVYGDGISVYDAKGRVVGNSSAPRVSDDEGIKVSPPELKRQ
jgi:hypothetical protein